MAGGLDQFLSVAVPLAVFVFFGFMVYKNFKPEFDSLFEWIKTKMNEGKNQNVPPYTVYQNPYLGYEQIVYR